MKKRAISTLLAVLTAVSLILPVLAADPSENAQTPVPAPESVENGETPASDTEPVENGDASAPDAEPVEDEDASASDAESAGDEEASEPADEETESKSFVFLDGAPQTVEYEIRNGTTYITLISFISMMDPQAVVEENNGAVTVSSAKVEQVVDDEGNTANVVLETLSMTVSTKVPYIVANGRYFYAKNSIVLLNDHVAAPLRTLAKVFNLDVDYDAEVHAALLNRVEGRRTYIEPGDSYYNADTLYWMSRIIYAESGNQPLEGMIAVGNVVMNRVRSPLFPNNIYDVLFQKNQFSPASTLTKRTPSSTAIVAAKLVMDGTEILPTALFFNVKGLNSFASRNRPYVTTIADVDFYA